MFSATPGLSVDRPGCYPAHGQLMLLSSSGTQLRHRVLRYFTGHLNLLCYNDSPPSKRRNPPGRTSHRAPGRPARTSPNRLALPCPPGPARSDRPSHACPARALPTSRLITSQAATARTSPRRLTISSQTPLQSPGFPWLALPRQVLPPADHSTGGGQHGVPLMTELNANYQASDNELLVGLEKRQ